MNPTPNNDVPTQPPATDPVRNPSRRTAAAVVTAGLLGGAAIGLFATVPSLTSAAAPATTVAAAAPAPTDPSDAPSDTDTDTDTDRTAQLTAKVRDSLQALVDDGTITAAQADAVAAHLAESVPMPGRDGRGGPRDGKGMFGAEDIDAFAQVLGLADGAALRTELESGKTIAEIAEANGVETDTVKNYLLAQLKTRIDAAVDAGKITQAEADAKLADADTMITEMINSNRPMRGPHGPRGDAPGNEDAPSDGASGDGPNIVQSDA